MKIIITNYCVIRKLIRLLFLLSFVLISANDKDILEYSHKLISKNRVDDAIVLLDKEIKKSKSEVDIAFLFTELGNAYKLKQQYEKSLDAYQKSLFIFKQKGLLENQFYVNTRLIELYRYRRMYEKANAYLQVNEGILAKIKVKDSYLAKFYSRKAAILMEYIHDKDSALIYSKKSLVLSQKLKDDDNVLVALLEIAGIYENKQNYTEAINQLKKIVILARKQENKLVECDAMVNLSRNYNFIKNYEKSIQVSLEGFKIAEKNKLSYNQLLFADNLKAVYTKTGDYKSALTYLDIRLRLTEDYYHKLYDEKVLEYEEKFKVAEKQKIIDQNAKLLVLKEAEIKRQALIRYFILFGLLVILIFAAILLYYIKIIKKQNKELKHISQQNEFLVSETHHRINNNLQLISILIRDELKKMPQTDSFIHKRIIAKIDSLGILHRQLYEHQDKKNLDLKVFLLDVKKNLDLLFLENNIKVCFDVESVVIPINNATYMGLLVTELCINSLKHAFPNQTQKSINLKIYQNKNDLVFLYTDNGELKNKITKLNLIDKLCRQLRVDRTIDTENGFSFKFITKL